MLFSFIASMFAATAVFAEISGHHDKKSKVCARQLEGIVHNPETCSYKYLRHLAHELKLQAALLFATPSQVASTLASFQANYGVNITLVDAFGYNLPKADPGVLHVPFGHTLARTYALGEAFTANTASPVDADNNNVDEFGTMIWNPDGEMVTAILSIDTSKAPLFC